MAGVASHPVLAAAAIEKSYGATRALRGAHLALAAGEIHALLGENGAGKSTLVKVLCGVVRPDAGTLMLRGRPIRPAGVREAVRAGIVPIYQHLSLMPHLTVQENLFAFEWARGGAFRGTPREATRAGAAAMLDRVGLAIDPGRVVGELSLAERQLLEIARGVARDCAVLVLDEPTAALNRGEDERLFAVLRDLCRHGTAVLYISHNLPEVEEVADRVSVLRDGATVLAGAARGTHATRDLVEMMVGHRLDERSRRALPQPGDPLLEATLAGPAGTVPALRLRAGEILGVAGLIGSGARRLGRGLAGLEPGRVAVRLAGRPIATGSRRAALAAGIGLVPGEREHDGLFFGRPVLENATAATLGELAPAGWLRRAVERARLVPWLRSLRVVPDDADLPVDRLSGGNQQKVLVARALASRRLRVLVAIEPTRGVDVGARDTIHQALVAAAREGRGLVVVSSDLEELRAICHRILVMRQGRIVAELPGDAVEADLLSALSGAAA